MRLYVVSLLCILFSTTVAEAIENGEKIPSLELETYAGEKISTDSFAHETVVLEWFNPGCPFVKKQYGKGDMQALQKKWKDNGVVWLTINSTEPSHQDFLTPEGANAIQDEWKITDTTLIRDETGVIGKRFAAKTTPHMFVIDKGVLVYQGAIDDDSSAFSDPKNAKNYVSTALEELASGKPLSTTETKSYGCSIKYKD